MKNILIFAGIGLALVIANIAGTYFIVGSLTKTPDVVATTEDSEPVTPEAKKTPEVKKTAIYFTVYPAFIVNIQGEGDRPKFMQTDLSVMAHEQADITAFELHMPAIRNALIMLFAGTRYEEIATPEGKEKLRLASLETIRASMEKAYGKPGIEDVYFTKLVIQ